jgi:iron complex outermembrane receptor protein
MTSRFLLPHARGISASGLAIAVAMAATSVAAQTTTLEPPADEGGIGEIIVTAQKRSENSQNVPIAITALSGDAIAASGVTSTLDLKAAAPSLQMTTAIGGFGLPRIRGVGSTGQGPGIENPVAVYVDGVYIMSAAANLLSLADVEQVAVLKGPQGTLFGRNATGGLIQITTRKPSYEMTGRAQFGYGNYDTVSAGAYVSGGLSKNVAVSLAGQYENRGKGFGKNLFNGHDVQTANSYALRAKLLWEPTDDTAITFAGDYSEAKGADPAFRPIGPNALGVIVPGTERDIYADVDPALDNRQFGGSLTISHDFDAARLVSISAYRDNDVRTFFDPDGTVSPNVVIDYNQRDKWFTQEVQLISTGTGPFSWVLGGFYMWGKGSQDPSRITGIFTFGNNGYSDLLTDQWLNSYAGFAQGTYALSDATKFTAGVRYTSDKRRLAAQKIGFNGNVPPSGAFVVQNALVNAEKTFNKVSWRLSLDHRFSNELMMYASYNRGFRSGAFVPQTFPPSVLQPEVVDAYEVGLKSDLLDRHLRINLAGYFYNQKNLQVMQIINGTQFVYNAEGAHVYGLDGDITAQLTDNLTLTAGFNYNHARYTRFTGAIIAVPLPLPAGFVIPTGQSCQGTFSNPYTTPGGNCLLIGDASGNRLQNAPDLTFSVGGKYTLPTEVGTFTLAANYYYNDGFVGDPDERVAQAKYGTLDASLTWRDTSDHMFVRLWGKNLTDSFYRTQLGASNTADNGTAAPPRTYGVTLGFDY